MANIQKRGKTWRYRVSYQDGDGKNKIKSKGGFRTKKEALAAATQLENDLNSGIKINQGDRLVEDYYKEWMDVYKIGQYSKGTDNFYKNALKLVKEYFPKTKMKEVERSDYQKFLNEYGEGRSKETVHKTHAKISACFKHAFHSGHIVANPCYRPRITGEKSKNRKEYLEKHEAEALLLSLLDGIELMYTTRYMLILQLATGMRIGEVMALQFKDINFLKKTVSITKSWDYVDSNDFKSTKNGESRLIGIDSSTLDIIKPFYDYQLNQRITDHKGRLFAKKGKLPTGNAINYALRRACERSDIPIITSHSLRHTHASLLLSDGVSLAYISKRLGHKDISITSDVYSHILDDLEFKEQEKAAGSIERMYGQTAF